MSWQENIGTIKEIYLNQYQIVLDFATNAIVPYLLDDDYKYVWVYQHRLLSDVEWQTYQLPLVDFTSSYQVLARGVQFGFVMPTTAFKKVLPKLPNGIALVQLNELPKFYLNPATIKGRTRYELLRKECDYLFEVDIPSATDYGTLISSNRQWLQSLLDDKRIDWTNLP